MNDNLKLWNAVEKTNPKHTKKANVRGNNITAIAPQSQIKDATAQFGSYGATWGWRSFDFTYELLESTGIVIFKGQFFFPGGEFPISTSISAYKDGARTKPDADFAKKVETDALTKALSKLGFNADVFMGLYDDNKYVQQMEAEFMPTDRGVDEIKAAVASNNYQYVKDNWGKIIKDKWQNLDNITIDKLNILFNQQ
jgi:hypothetical protein